MTPSLSAASCIRAASRSMVRELGLMNKTLFDDALSISAIHALIEIESRNAILAQQLSELLVLEKSTVSRLVKNLVDRGYIVQEPSSHDRRQFYLSLTTLGSETCRRIQTEAENQVLRALDRAHPAVQNTILVGLEEYAKALNADRLSLPIPNMRDSITITTGYITGVLGAVVALHMNYYSESHQFGIVFETSVAAGLATFIPRLDHSVNEMWCAVLDDKIIGSISVDGQNTTIQSGKSRGHIRWFIVDVAHHGTGIGASLLEKAVEFCDSMGFDEIHLSTFRGLDAARALYERHNFTLTDERVGTTWGTSVVEQEFVRQRCIGNE